MRSPNDNLFTLRRAGVKVQILERMKNGEELIFVDAVIEFGKNDTMLDKVLKIHDKQNPEACYVSESFIKSA
nr:hypothetical protein [uncultured Flavobacterium sp.]